MAMDICQPTVDPVVANRQSSVVYAQQMKNGCVDIIDLGWVLSIQRLVAKRVARPMSDSSADAPTT
jgi:hypothetical protein